MTSTLIAEQLKQLPARSGVYLLKNAEGNVLYVGKAANLHHRVRAYFSDGEKLSPKLRRMVARVSDLDFFVTNSEQEALILEYNLIKRYRPRYNVRLKDDKAFPYLKIDLGEDWPQVHVTRRLEGNGARYFGPFASMKSVKQTLKALKTIFPIRFCSRPITGTDLRPCLQYHTRHCLGPCIGQVSKEEYNEVVKQVVLFLEGKQKRVIQELENRMKQAAEALDFEKAARIRDQIQAIERVIEGQRIAVTVSGEKDVIAFAQNKDQALAQVFFIRNGKLIGKESFILDGTTAEEPEQIMTSFIKQFYSSAPYIPPLILLQYPVEDKMVIEQWLQSKRGGAVHIQVPRRGNKRQLVNIVAENAEQGLQLLKLKQQVATSEVLATALSELQKELRLPQPPSRIEGYDISNIQGKAAVGSMVVFEEGKPKPSHYRRFRIKTVSGADDYSMLQEVLHRRFKRAQDKDAASGVWAELPDLVLIDGGKGQLNAAQAAMQEAGVGSVPVASLAKEREEMFVPQQSEPILLPGSSPGLQLLQHVRDEAHRFALGYHLKVRRKESFTSSLDDIPGIGPKRKRALLRHFGSVQAMREAPVEELASVEGISRNLASKIKELLG